MISQIHGGQYLNVTSNPGYTPYVNPTQPMSGMVRYHQNGLEVYDGTTWHKVGGGSSNINLTGEAIELLEWAKRKRAEEVELENLALKNPTIKDLTDKVKLYQDQIKMVRTLIKKDREWSEVEVQSAP